MLPASTLPRVIWAPEQLNWCFHNISLQVSSCLQGCYRSEVVQALQLAKGETDIAVVLWWNHVPHVNSNIRCKAIVAGVYDCLSWGADNASMNQFRMVLRQATCLAVANREIKEGIQKLYGMECPPIFVTEDGVDTTLFRMVELPNKFSLGWTGNSTRHTPGGPGDQKGLGIIQQAARLSKTPLRILDGKDGGIWPLSRMPVFYQDISVYCCASYKEGTPNPVLESLSMGRPVVSTRVGLAQDLIKDGVNGYLVERTPEAMAEAILKIKSLPPEDLRRMCEAARASVIRQSWQDTSMAWKECLDYAWSQRGVKDRISVPIPRAKPAKVVCRGVEQSTVPAVLPLVHIPAISTEAKELRGEMHGSDQLQDEILRLESRVDLQSARPCVYILSRYRFLTRTSLILKGLVHKYRFVVADVVDDEADLAWSFYPFHDSAALQGSKGHIPFVQSIRGQFWHMGKEHIRNSLRSIKSADCVTTLTRATAMELGKRWPELRTKWITVVPNGGYAGRIPESTRGEEGSLIPKTFPKPHVICSTNFNFEEKRRGVDEIVTELDKSSFLGSLIIAGNSGPYSPPVGRIGRTATNIGFVSDRFQLCREADAFFYLSYMDGQPTCVIEAMSASLPVIAGKTTGSGVDEFISHGDTGLIFNGATEGMKMLLDLLSKPGEMKRLGENAGNYIKRSLTWERTSAEFDRIFTRLIKER